MTHPPQRRASFRVLMCILAFACGTNPRPEMRSRTLAGILRWSGDPNAKLSTPSSRRQTAVRTFLAGRGVDAVPEGSRWVPFGNDEYALIEAGEHRGDGVTIYRREAESELIVQAPHRYFDRQTLPIAQRLYRTLGARALLVNSVHRYRGDDCDAREDCASDVVRNSSSIFHAAHRGLMQAHPGATVLAIHGFAAREGEPDIILSAGGTRTELVCLARELRELTSGPSLGMYPSEIRRLGGVRGEQAKDLRQRGARFVHLELSEALRETLVEDSSLHTELGEALRTCLLSPTHEPERFEIP